MDALAESLARSPELFPHSLDVQGNTVSFIRLSRTDYANASFLDGRILTPHTVGRAIPWPQIARSVEGGRTTESCHFIFHIGHVGSTLVSRLLGVHSTLFGVREPSILRSATDMRNVPETQPRVWNAAEFEARISVFLKLLSRTFDPDARAVVKATSFVSELAAELLARPYQPKALLMFVSPESFLATILGGPNSRKEARLLAESRLKRLHRRLARDAWRLSQLSEGEAIAMGWACEMTALACAAKVAGARAQWHDFDRFLAEPDTMLTQAFRHFDVEAKPASLRAILEGPDMRRYSKGPEHAYDAQLRRDVLDAARAKHGAEIKRGLAWLDRASAEFALIGEVIAQAD
jgi:hypothetical protein